MAPHFCVFIPVLLCCFTFSLGSRIQFSSQPAQVTPSLTPEVTLTCGLHDTDPVTSGNLVGRDLHDVIHTDENMKFVTVVSLLHNTERVASVSEHVQAKILNKWTNAAVTGKVDSSSSTKGFLSVTITAPQVNQTGHFSCEIHTLHPVDFQDVKFSQTVAVTAVPPTLAQWIDHTSHAAPAAASSLDIDNVRHKILTTDRDIDATIQQEHTLDTKIESVQKQISGMLSNAPSDSFCQGSHQFVSSSTTSEKQGGQFLLPLDFLFTDVMSNNTQNCTRSIFLHPYSSPPKVYYYVVDSTSSSTKWGFQTVSMVSVSASGLGSVDKEGVTFCGNNSKLTDIMTNLPFFKKYQMINSRQKRSWSFPVLTALLTPLAIGFVQFSLALLKMFSPEFQILSLGEHSKYIAKDDHVEIVFPTQYISYNNITFTPGCDRDNQTSTDMVTLNFTRSYNKIPLVYWLPIKSIDVRMNEIKNNMNGTLNSDHVSGTIVDKDFLSVSTCDFVEVFKWGVRFSFSDLGLAFISQNLSDGAFIALPNY